MTANRGLSTLPPTHLPERAVFAGHGCVDEVVKEHWVPKRKINQPLYAQIKQDLMRRVVSGEWRPGDCLPSESNLALQYEASLGTVRRAIEELAGEGLVNRYAGRGTFVNSHGGSPYERFNFHRLSSTSGKRVADEASDFIAFESVQADSTIAAGLGIEEGEPGIQFLRLRAFAEKPVLLERIFFRERWFPEIAGLIRKHRPHSVYLLMEQHYHILVTQVQEKLRAVAASDVEAAHLQIPIGSPVLHIERIALDMSGTPVEWRLMTAVTHEVHYACSSS